MQCSDGCCRLSVNILKHSEWFQDISSHFEFISLLPLKGQEFGKVKLCPERIMQRRGSQYFHIVSNTKS